MKKILSRGLAIAKLLPLLTCTGVFAQTTPPPAEPAEPQNALRHVAAARLIADTEFAAVADGYLCLSPQRAQAYLLPYLAALGEGEAGRQSGAAFDNLYYIGVKFVGTWLLKTDRGLILFDAMFNDHDAQTIIVAGIKDLGLDPRDIKHVILTHGHFDHYGGARYLQDTFGASVWLSEADWDYMEANKDQDPPAALRHLWPDKLPRRDAIAKDGDVLELGGETVRFVLTPGHTPGVVSAVISVRDQGVRRFITLWGGTAMPPDSTGLRQMHASLLKLWRAGEAAGAEGVISTHAFVEGSFDRFERKSDAAPNPFNLGRDGYNRVMAIHSECMLAQAARYEAWGR